MRFAAGFIKTVTYHKTKEPFTGRKKKK